MASSGHTPCAVSCGRHTECAGSITIVTTGNSAQQSVNHSFTGCRVGSPWRE